jgi:hypothetical protein
MGKESKLGKIVILSKETSKRLAETPLKIAYHIFVDLRMARGEYVTSQQFAEAERCRLRTPYYNPF